MTAWEKKIIDAFISHYFASVPDTGDNRTVLRLRSSIFFPDFDTVSSDEKESYLEAAESLEQKGIVKLSWEKRSKGERLNTLSCENFEKLFEEADQPFPENGAEEIRSILAAKVKELKVSFPALTEKYENVCAFLEYLSSHFGPREIGQGFNRQTVEDLVRLLEFCTNPEQLEKITTRSLSILLYRNSKRLENLIALCKPLFLKAEKNISVPDLSFLERSYPETMISGRIIIEYKDGKTPLINAGGHILGIPLENAIDIKNIQPVSGENEKTKPSAGTVLTIENKETFFALGAPQKHENKEQSGFNCFLYIGGYLNRASGALIKALAVSGFSFYHAGDLDPDGILILQQIREIAERPVTPVRMDTDTFDQYRAWARTLTRPMLRQIEKINSETRAVPGLDDLLRRIEETGLGIEQEIIDYRQP